MRQDVKQKLQVFFNKAVVGMASQDWKISVKETGYVIQTAYYGDNNRKCPIGWCIPKGKYSPSLEGISVLAPSVLKALGIKEDEVCLQNAIDKLQKCHDVFEVDADKNKVIDSLLLFANEFNLKIG